MCKLAKNNLGNMCIQYAHLKSYNKKSVEFKTNDHNVNMKLQSQDYHCLTYCIKIIKFYV